MIIYGTRSKTLNPSNDAPLLNCNNCGATQSVVPFKYFRYFHIFWIPFFPFSSGVVTQCSHCKQVKKENEMSQNEREQAKSANHSKIPFGYFIGLIGIGLVIVFAGIGGARGKADFTKNIKNPQVGDVYEMQVTDNGKKMYTIYRITDVNKDSVTFETNNYGATTLSKLSRLKREHANDYSPEKIAVPITDLQKMKDNDEIRNIIKR